MLRRKSQRGEQIALAVRKLITRHLLTRPCGRVVWRHAKTRLEPGLYIVEEMRVDGLGRERADVDWGLMVAFRMNQRIRTEPVAERPPSVNLGSGATSASQLFFRSRFPFANQSKGRQAFQTIAVRDTGICDQSQEMLDLPRMRDLGCDLGRIDRC